MYRNRVLMKVRNASYRNLGSVAKYFGLLGRLVIVNTFASFLLDVLH